MERPPSFSSKQVLARKVITFCLEIEVSRHFPAWLLGILACCRFSVFRNLVLGFLASWLFGFSASFLTQLSGFFLAAWLWASWFLGFLASCFFVGLASWPPRLLDFVVFFARLARVMWRWSGTSLSCPATSCWPRRSTSTSCWLTS